MLENSKWLNGDFITLNEARKDGRGLSLILEITNSQFWFG